MNLTTDFLFQLIGEMYVESLVIKKEKRALLAQVNELTTDKEDPEAEG